MTASKFYCGTSNVVLPVPNKSYFPQEYQDKSRLCYYASLFNTVEINSSFYKIPQRKTVERWAAEVNDDFLFTFKLWQGITHAKELNYNETDVKVFMNAVNGVGGKKGCLLVQLPASVKYSSVKKIRGLLDQVFTIPYWKIAVEFRDRSWYNDHTYQMLEQYNASVVVHDMPGSAPPAVDMEISFCYFRFHGEKGDYKGSYENDVLNDQAIDVAYNLKAGLQTFAYFNNTIGSAVSNAFALRDMVEGLYK